MRRTHVGDSTLTTKSGMLPATLSSRMIDHRQMTAYSRLFTPLDLAGRRLKNRIAFPAVLPNFAQQYRVTDRMVTYYAERAIGGVGMIITEGMSVHPSDRKSTRLNSSHQ